MQKKRNEDLIDAEILSTKKDMTNQTCEHFCNSQKDCFAFDIDTSTGALSQNKCTSYKEKTSIATGYGSEADGNKICYWKLPQITDSSHNSEKCQLKEKMNNMSVKTRDSCK